MVNLSIIFLNLFSRIVSFLASFKLWLKTYKYKPSENSYISLIYDNPTILKKRMAPLLATGAYPNLAASISLAVSVPYAIASVISMDFYLVYSNVAINSSLSSNDPLESVKHYNN